jgi:cell division protein FtsB
MKLKDRKSDYGVPMFLLDVILLLVLGWFGILLIVLREAYMRL